jgi:type IV pilus assembly protein PilY1
MNKLFLRMHMIYRTQHCSLSAWIRGTLAIATLITLGVGSSSAQTLSQVPLANRSLPVKPNLVLDMDASGSMGWACIYKPHVQTLLLAAGSTAGLLNPGCLGGTDLREISPDNNALAYDPRKRYKPRFNNAGIRLPDSVVPATYPAGGGSINVYFLNPATLTSAIASPTTVTTAQLTTVGNYNLLKITNAGFCWANVATAAGTCTTITALNPLGTKSTDRSDCAGAVCTLAEEKLNHLHWATYHFDRLSASKVGVGAAFSRQPDSFRLSWMTIQDAAPVNTIADYGLPATRTSFYTWLNGLTSGASTPLKTSLDNVGQYYQTTPNTGPWGNKPWDATSAEGSSAQLSCRRSYAILTTDGLWNDTTDPASVNGRNTDSINGPVITHADGGTYQYKPRVATDPRSVGKSDNFAAAGGSNATLADVAMHYWVNDLRPGTTGLVNNTASKAELKEPFWQNMTTFTVSVGAPSGMTSAAITAAKNGTGNWSTPAANTVTALDDLIHAAHNGGGDFLAVTDADSFAKKLSDALAKITAVKDSQAGVSSSSGALIAGSRKYVPNFTSGQWWGNLSAVVLDASGGPKTGSALADQSAGWSVVRTDSSGSPVVPNVSTIPTPFTSRNIYVWKDVASKAVKFDWANVGATGVGGLRSSTPATDKRTQLASTVTEDMVRYLAGDRANEEGNTGTDAFRSRLAVMGDITNSTPLYVKYLGDPGYNKLGLPGYAEYLKSKKERTKGLLFAGANDGMLHAFDIDNGAELWAYVPRAILGKLHRLANPAYTHEYYVDGPSVEADAYLSEGWRNLVLGSVGAGGRAVFAVNVNTTNPTSGLNGSSVRWEINDSATDFAELGSIITPIQTGMLQDGRWVAVFGNGYESNSCRSSLFVVKLEDGSLIKKIDAETASGTTSLCAGTTKNGLGGVRLMFNSDNKIIGAYAGDLQGNVWKFNAPGTGITNWALGNGGKPLFTAKNAAGGVQAITAPPAVVVRTDQPKYNPSYMVVVGTGKLHEIEDQANKTTQSAYGLWDRYGFTSTLDDSIASRTSLVPVNTTFTKALTVATDILSTSAGTSNLYTTTPSKNADWTMDRGWVLDYSIKAGQRTITPIEKAGRIVRIDTMIPKDPAPSCSDAAGEAFNYLVEPLTGGCKSQTTLDTNGDGVIDKNDSTACVFSTTSDGSDTVLNVSAAVIAANDGTGTENPGGTGGSSSAKPTSDLRMVENTNGKKLIRVDEIEPPPIAGAAKVTQRAWRQIFMR